MSTMSKLKIKGERDWRRTQSVIDLQNIKFSIGSTENPHIQNEQAVFGAFGRRHCQRKFFS